MNRLERLLSFLLRPRSPARVVLIASLLLAPCLFTRLVLDDYVLATKSGVGRTVAGLPIEPLWLFTFTTGDPAQNQRLMDEGVLLPWWSEPNHLNAFFRPLTSLTHLLDFRAWPSSSFLMHLHSLLWYALLLFALERVYRAIEPDSALLVGLSFLLFAVDDAHGATVGWVANRNAVIAVAFGLPALLAFHRSAVGSRAAAWVGPFLFALSLCAGETAFSIAGYMFAYALCLDRRSWLRRAGALAPYVALLLAHRGAYRLFGLGSYGSSAYRNPLQEPFEFLISLGYNLPVLLSSKLLLPLADHGFFGPPQTRWVLWVISVLGLLALARPVFDCLKRDAHARFWSAGMVLSAIPVSASLPGERLLLVLGIGASPLLARLLAPLADPVHRAALGRRLPVLVFVLFMHGVIGPLTLPLRAAAMEPVARQSERLNRGIPSGPEVQGKVVIVVNAPLVVMVSYLQLLRATRDEPRPTQLLMLASSSSDIAVSRLGPARLRVELEEGFLFRLEEQHYRADLMRGTDTISLRNLEATVVARTEDQRPKAVEFALDAPFEDARYLWRVYRDGALVPWQPPAAGTIEHFEKEEFFPLVLKELLP